MSWGIPPVSSRLDVLVHLVLILSALEKCSADVDIAAYMLADINKIKYLTASDAHHSGSLVVPYSVGTILGLSGHPYIWCNLGILSDRLQGAHF